MLIVMFLITLLIIPGIVAFIMSLMLKWEIIKWLQLHAPNKFFDKLFRCNLCMIFWITMGISICLSVYFWSWIFLLLPIITTVETKNIYEA